MAGRAQQLVFTQIRSGMGQYTPSTWSFGGEIDTAFETRNAARVRLVGGGKAPPGRGVLGLEGCRSSPFIASKYIEIEKK